MVWRKLGLTTIRRKNSKVNVVISLLLVLICSLMFDLFSGGDARRRSYGFVDGKSDGGVGVVVGVVFWMTGGGVGGGSGGGYGYGSQSNAGIAIAVTVMAGLAVAATLVYSNR
ncbi:hypothetical protein Hanom_Chr17g01526611 [Helianthus anomalus]